MTSPLALRIFGWLLSAALTFLVAAAHAASGYSITPGDETSISVGVTDAEVRDRLGPPAHIRQYLNRPGTTWTCEVARSAVRQDGPRHRFQRGRQRRHPVRKTVRRRPLRAACAVRASAPRGAPPVAPPQSAPPARPIRRPSPCRDSRTTGRAATGRRRTRAGR